MGFIKINVEVPLLLTFFGVILVDSILGNLVIYRTCYVTLGYNKTECARLGQSTDPSTAELEKAVQPEAAVINMARGIVEGCVTATLCLFVGPWSDKFGRRPVLLACATGYFVNIVMMAIYSALDISAWYLIIVSIPYMITGGMTTYLAAVLCYATDCTSDADRGIRMSILEATLEIGTLLGTLTSSHVFYSVGYFYSCLIAASCIFVALLYTIFFVPESLENPDTIQSKFKGFFDTSNMKEMLRTPIKPREGYNRSIVLLMIVIQIIFIFAIYGGASVFTLFLREKFHYTLEEYTNYNSLSSVIWISGASVGMLLLHKLLKIPESVLVLCGFISMLNSELLYGLANQVSMLYAAAAMKFMGALLGPMTRSLISKRVQKDEVGKIFSFMLMAQAVLSLGASPLFVAIYDSTIDKNPATFFFVTAGLYTVNVVLISIVILLQNLWRCSKYTPLLAESDLNEEVDVASNNVSINSTVVTNT